MAKFILDGQEYGGGSGSKIVKLTQAEYDALPNDKLSDDIIYLIKDSGELTAENLFYDGSETGLGNTVQDAVDNLDEKVSEQNKKFEFDFSSKSGITSINEAFQAMWDRLYPKVLYLIHNTVIDNYSIGSWVIVNSANAVGTVREDVLINMIVEADGTSSFYTNKTINITNFTNLKIKGTFQGRNHKNSASNNTLKIGVGNKTAFVLFTITQLPME